MSFFIGDVLIVVVGFILSHKQMELLEMSIIANVATIAPDGMPKISPTWVIFQDGKVYFSTRKDRAKYRHIMDNPRVGICIVHPKGSVYLSFFGTAEIRMRDEFGIYDLVTERIVRKYVHSDEKSREMIKKLRTDDNRVLVEIIPIEVFPDL